MRIIWRRLLTNPTTRIESRQGDLTLLQVDGLVCDQVCAVRTKRALEALPGVRSASVDLETGIATIDGEAHDAAAYERAVTRAVAAKPVRRAIERVHQAFQRRASGHSADAGEHP
jgi:copper chaperone CopZ